MIFYGVSSSWLSSTLESDKGAVFAYGFGAFVAVLEALMKKKYYNLFSKLSFFLFFFLPFPERFSVLHFFF